MSCFCAFQPAPFSTTAYDYLIRMTGEYIKAIRLNPGQKPQDMPASMWKVIVAHEEAVKRKVIEEALETARKSYTRKFLDSLTERVKESLVSLCGPFQAARVAAAGPLQASPLQAARGQSGAIQAAGGDHPLNAGRGGSRQTPSLYQEEFDDGSEDSNKSPLMNHNWDQYTWE